MSDSQSTAPVYFCPKDLRHCTFVLSADLLEVACETCGSLAGVVSQRLMDRAWEAWDEGELTPAEV